MEKSDIDLSVSYDFQFRERHEVVLHNMRNLTKPIHVLILATPDVMTLPVSEMIATLNTIPALHSVEIKPYSTNQANQYSTSHLDYERFIQQWITSTTPKQFVFSNELDVRRAITGNRNAFSDDHLYITPQGTFAVLEFDLNDNEFFRPVSYDQYVEWTLTEKAKAFSNPICGGCEYLGRCLTEHLRDVKSREHSCNGYYNLIQWYKNERLEG
jgi:hypothetical protein